MRMTERPRTDNMKQTNYPDNNAVDLIPTLPQTPLPAQDIRIINPAAGEQRRLILSVPTRRDRHR